MTNKNRAIIRIIKLVNKVFGVNAPQPNDDYSPFDDIGLQKGDKVIYINTSSYKKFGYYYSCDVLDNDPEIILRSLYDGQTSSKEELLQIIEKFFEIKRVVT